MTTAVFVVGVVGVLSALLAEPIRQCCLASANHSCLSLRRSIAPRRSVVQRMDTTGVRSFPVVESQSPTNRQRLTGILRLRR